MVTGREPSRRARGMAQGTATRPSDRLHIGAGCGMNREAIPGTSQRRELHPGEPSIGKKEDRLSNERFIGVQQLKELCNLDPEILIQHIIIESNGFFGLLHTNGLSSEACELILQIVHSASTCQEVPSTKIKLLSELKHSKFLRSELSRYLVKLTTKENVCKLKESLLYSLSIMEVLLTCMPSSLPDVMVLYGTFEMVYRHYKDKGGSSSEAAAIENHMITVSILIKDLAEARRKNSKTSRYSREDGASPPDDFREISIFPQLKDIHLNETPFLRANKDKGGYKDLNHYLDVQFWLMREDLVAPLRDGIFEFKSSGERGNKYKDIRLYYDVKVLYPVCTPKGMLHQIRFNTSRLRKVKWEVSKRLIYGSLLCLSKDNFTTLCFATVAEREPPDLVKGILYVKFECDQQMIDGISTDNIFLMAETSAYFESYRHVLRGLQSVGDDMPFQKYIVYCDNNVEPPSYLRRNQKAVYDLKPLIYQDSKVAIKDTDTDDSTDVEHQSIATVESNESDDDFGFWLSTKTDNNFEDNTVSFTNVASAEFLDSGDFRLAHAESINSSRGIQDTKLKSEVEVLDIACWPSGEQLHLDKSQLLAVQYALTKEFVVIQGPPGTGKTYVGLEVVKLLLHNRDIWSREGERPLLVVCYTNHALDQFLEGIQQFHDSGIIRIGTRSQSKVVEKYFLKNVRKAEQYFIPVEIRQGLSDSQSIIDRLEATMNENSFLLEATEIGVLHEDVLEPYMHESHYHQLTLKMPSKLQHRKSRCKIKSLMKEWLNCGSTVVHGPLYDDTAFESAGQEDSENFDEGVDIEGDAAFEEAQRRLDDDDSKYNESKGALEGVTRPKRAMDRHARMKIEDDVLAIKANSFHTDTQNLESGCKDDWYIGTKEKERRKRMLKEELKKVTHMTYQEADLVTNIWKMPLVQRWQLYRYWINAYKSKIRGKIVEIERQYLDEHERLNGLKQRESLELMQNATILGMTTTGAAQHWQVLQKVEPRIIIVEEAAEVMESHIVTTLSHGCEHLILIGDHKQLRPNPTVYHLAVKYNLDISLFERMVSNGMKCITLEQQHRMRPEIAMLMEPIYPKLRNHESVQRAEDIMGINKNIFFVDHSREEQHHEDTKSHSNEHEAKYIAALCHYLLKQGYNPEQITVLTTYSGQLFALKNFMPKHVFNGVRICVVDNYQGEENDIILLSLVRSNKEQRVGFLKTENRVCVALSRAKKGLYVIGNITMLANQSDLWSRIMHILRRQDSVGPHLDLSCRNHPKTKIEAKDADDFNKAPAGGCMLSCDFRLKCGHVCEMPCHVMNVKHKKYKCFKRCTNILCENGHVCPKRCFEECGDCDFKVPKVLPECGHKNMVPCHISAEEFVCKLDCKRKLFCGHQCAEECGQPCTRNCEVMIQKTRPRCGHTVNVKCCIDPLKSPCQEPCNTEMNCGHRCSGTRGSCLNGRLHNACKMPCKKILICGHMCTQVCSKDCPPCQEQCENHCVHRRCPLMCGVPCEPCMEPCVWRCEHARCLRRCSEPCSRYSCTKWCRKRLKCGHLCIGLCGEECPDLCSQCNREEVGEIFFGTEDSKYARFVQLQDCRHVLEVSGLDKWMRQNASNNKHLPIQMKECPKCKTPIRQNLRYSYFINKMMVDINNVKKKIHGTKLNTEAAKSLLVKKLDKTRDDATCRHFCLSIKRDLQNGSIDEEVLQMYQMTVEIIDRLLELRTRVTKLEQEQTSMDKEKDEDQEQKSLLVKEAMQDLHLDIDKMLNWCHRERLRFSEQQMQDASLELSRMSMLFTLVEIYRTIENIGIDHDRPDFIIRSPLPIYPTNGQKNCSEKRSPLMEVQVCIQAMHVKLTDENRQRYKKKLQDLKKEVPLSWLLIGEEERVMIVKAIGFSKDHWYKCWKGHIYAIGECGGAGQESVCPECKYLIGGRRHKPADSKRHTSKMNKPRVF